MFKQIFDGIYYIDNRLATESYIKKIKVYGEEHIIRYDKEYRFWNPYRSKLAAAIMNRMKNEYIKKGDSVLYLGAATGTTSSHVSDIVGDEGLVYCVEISERNMRDLLKVCEYRKNMLPLLTDARYIEKYSNIVDKCDIIYQDVSSPDQAYILKENSVFLKKGGYAYFAIKSQSIDIKSKPEKTFKKTLDNLTDIFDIVEEVKIEPYHKLHLFVVLKKR